MRDDGRSREASTNLPPLFISGHFADRITAGERPTYGYPVNHLPETTSEEMEVVTTFIASRKRK